MSNTSMNFDTLIAGYPTATPAHYEHSQTLKKIAYFLGDDKLKYITDDISVNGEFKPTTNSIGVVMHNPQGQPSNLAIYPLDQSNNTQSKPFLLSQFDNECFIVGDGGEVVAVADIAGVGDFWLGMEADKDRLTVICPFEPWQFDSLVKAYAKQTQVTVFTDYLAFEKQRKTFKADNVRLVAPHSPINDMLAIYDSLDGVLSDEQTKIEVLGGHEWGEIEPLDDTTTPATPYPIHAFTGVLREAVEAISYHAQVPQAMAGQCVLGALSTIGQRFINAPIGHSHKPASLYLITEGGTGSGKTEANKLSHYSVMQWEQNIYQQFINDTATWEADRNALKGAERTHYEATIPKPVNQNMMVKDATIESILDRFIIDGLNNQSWTTSEAGQFLGGHSLKSDTVGNALSSLTSIWSGDSVSRLRSQRGNNPQYKTNAYNVRFTLDLQGQRVLLEPALTNALLNEQGFLPRCLIACPESLQGHRTWNTDEKLDSNPELDPRLQAYWTRCNILLDPPPSEILTDKDGKEIRFNMPFENRQAMKTLADFQQEIENRQAKGNVLEFLRGFASRMAENASRIASLMAFFDCQKVVSVDYLKRAFLLVEYSTAERLRYMDIKPNEKNDSQKLIDWLVSKAGKANPPKLNKSFVSQNAPTSLRGKKLDPLLRDLESMGYIRLEQIERKKLVYINPCLYKHS